MSDQTPQGGFSPGFDDPAPRGGFDGRARRALVAGAAGVVLLGSITGGYLWVSSGPTAETAVAVAPGGAPQASPTGAPSSAAPGFAPVGTNLFDDSFLPHDAPAVAGDGTSTGASMPAPVATSATSATSATPSAPVVPVPTATRDIGKSAGAAATPTSTPTRPAPATPTPTKSALPGWEISHYSYLEKAEDGVAGKFITQYTDGRGGYETTLLPGSVLYPADVTFVGLTKDMAHVHSNRGLRDGWYVPAGNALPDPGMGGSTKQLRLSAIRNSKVFYFQIDRGSWIEVAVDEKIPGTDFTVKGLNVEGFSQPGDNYFWLTDSKGVIWYGSVGGGEDAGLLF
ncbi:hypothetical protein [Kineococcus rhizosphaerae]|uniref:Uncharacterized protein n=1 Tax=Kineococcus rhizosphaerae TaxID=559628 RepID=A0A2T0R9T0_9ACTN|nr:hypothetical protein [Kineococcus rhizosphaerae]PRY17914.1 hypothetical protein CLV37_101156 [Kineococcus rhizosphaerae]